MTSTKHFTNIHQIVPITVHDFSIFFYLFYYYFAEEEYSRFS